MDDNEKAKLTEIIQREYPGAKVAEYAQYQTIPGLDQPTDAPDLQSIDLDDLRRKYLGDEPIEGLDSAATPTEIEDFDEPTQRMVDVEFPGEQGPGFVKTMVISETDEEITGQQG